MRRVTTAAPRSVACLRVSLCAALMHALLAAAGEAGAQVPRRRAEPAIRPELRLDYLSSPDAIQAGAGAAMRFGTYLRVAGIVGAGPHFSDAGDRFGWRAELVGRFQLDPFRERRWAPYASAGVSVRGAGSDAQEYLLVLIGVEGPLARGWSPALEAGLGGGARVGLVLRRSGPRYR